MIMGELPSKYHKELKHFLHQHKNIVITKQIFVNIEFDLIWFKLIFCRKLEFSTIYQVKVITNQN